jgi:sugar O-acyltransferase (sialic acid O-acetyltransferase NeuD family)
MVKQLLIFGTTGLARLACWHAQREGMNVIGFAVDAPGASPDARLPPLPVHAWDDAAARFDPRATAVFVAIGYRSMQARERVWRRVVDAGFSCASILSSAAWIADDAVLGDNNFVMPGAIVEPGCQLGSNNVLWSRVTLCHDSRIGSHNFIAAGTTIGGRVTLGERNFLGFSTTVLQDLRIGDDVLVGAASLVTHDLESLNEYRGTPARRHRGIDPASGVEVTRQEDASR